MLLQILTPFCGVTISVLVFLAGNLRLFIKIKLSRANQVCSAESLLRHQDQVGESHRLEEEHNFQDQHLPNKGSYIYDFFCFHTESGFQSNICLQKCIKVIGRKPSITMAHNMGRNVYSFAVRTCISESWNRKSHSSKPHNPT